MMSLKKSSNLSGNILGGRYKLLNPVGGGGMARVYKAKDQVINRFVAIKVLNDSLSNDSEFVRRFSREAQAAASLSHPNIVSVYDVGVDNEVHYIVMELIEGPTLKKYITECAPLDIEEVAEITLQICDALTHAHENSIIHRDIKPHNILLGPNGRAKVTDFGIARAASSATITQTGSIMGSVHYFSPEQARGVTISEQSDIYSLGVILYEMLTGRLPFQGDSAISIALKHLEDAPTPINELNPHVNQELANIIKCCLEKKPENRYKNALDISEEVTKLVKSNRNFKGKWKDLKLSNYKIEDTQNNNNGPTLSLDSKTDLDKTLLQRTVQWINQTTEKLPLWKKILFIIFSVCLVFSISIPSFIAIQGWLSPGSKDSDKVENVTNVKQTPLNPISGEIDVKDYHGLFESRIEALKKEAGKEGYNLKIIYCADQGSDAVQSWQVYKQEPAAGSKISKGDTINTYVKFPNIKTCRPK